MFEMVGAAGALALAGGARGAWAQSAKRIERLAPELDAIIDTSQPIRELATGFGGDIGPAEGPVWIAEGRYLLFNDIQTSRRMKYTPGQGVVVAKTPTNEANGLTRDLQGRLISAEHVTRRVTREDPDGSITVVANNFQGKRLLQAERRHREIRRRIYFTDPGGPLAPDQFDVTVAGVYRVSPDLGSISLIVDDLIGPNGLAFSPDERVLYVNDARRRIVRAYDLLPNGTVAKQTSRLFADMGGPEPGVPDGMKVDTAGNVYTGGAGGLYIMDKTGKKLGRIVHGQPATTNVAFGGDDWKTLYFTTRSSLNMVTVKIRRACLCRPGRGRRERHDSERLTARFPRDRVGGDGRSDACSTRYTARHERALTSRAFRPTAIPRSRQGIRSRRVANVNGLTVHMLEAGYETPGRPAVLLLHGFPELAYSWRKVMLPLASAGYHVIAPDQRGYGRTTGWDDSLRRRSRSLPHPQHGERCDRARLRARLPLRGDGGGTRRRSAGRVVGRAHPAGRLPLGDDHELTVRRSAVAAVRHG